MDGLHGRYEWMDGMVWGDIETSHWVRAERRTKERATEKRRKRKGGRTSVQSSRVVIAESCHRSILLTSTPPSSPYLCPL
jgi:hypothetical protein